MKSHLSDKEKEAVEYLASLGYSRAEIFENLQLTGADMEEECLQSIKLAYLKGKNKLKLESRISLKGLAVNGSHPALIKIISLQEKQEEDEFDFEP